MSSPKAADFIAKSPADKPFLLYVPFNAPHTPMQAKPADLAKYVIDGIPDFLEGKHVFEAPREWMIE